MKLVSMLHTSLSTVAATLSVQAKQPSDRRGHLLPAGYPKTSICPRAGLAVYKHFFTAIVLALAFCAASAIAQRPSKKLPSGMFSTRGNQVVDQHQNPVRLSCIYWAGLNGFDGTLFNFTSPLDGYQANINAMAAGGFNCIRVDFNNISLHQGNVSAFLSSLDQVVAAAGVARLRVIIVDHDNEGNFGSNDGFTNDCAAQQSNGIWYDLGGASNGTDNCNDPGTVTQASYQSDWVSIASRYARNDTVIGYDLWNEPLEYGDSLWGGGSDRDIHLMYETVGSAMLAKDPSKLIFAECPQNYAGTLYDGAVGNAPWGDCTGVRNTPVVFTVNGQSVTNKVVYDVHLYPNSVSGIASLFGGSSSSPAAIQAMNYSFGYLESENIAPVWDGESGTGLGHDPDDQDWANMLDAYLNGKLGSQGGPTFSRDQQGMGIAWEDWQVLTPGGLGIMNSDGSLDPTITAIVDPLLYY
jgi:aryl-phospho-beta-D-glucosidase BglC (GH1 family)